MNYDNLETQTLLNELPENRPLYRDSGAWQIRSDDMEEVLYQQHPSETTREFLVRCHKDDNEWQRIGKWVDESETKQPTV